MMSRVRLLSTRAAAAQALPLTARPAPVLLEKFGVVVMHNQRKTKKETQQQRKRSYSSLRCVEKFGVAVQLPRRELPFRKPALHWNVGYEELFRREEAEGLRQSSSGAMAVDTGKYTGRSPKDKYFVDEPSSRDKIWWGDVNQKLSEGNYDALKKKVLAYLESKKELYVYEGQAASGTTQRLPLRVVTEFAWQHHFCKNMFREMEGGPPHGSSTVFTVYNASGLQIENPLEAGLNSEAFVIFHLGKREAIIGGTSYTGEMKKGIFSVLNYLKPRENVLPMHCAANVGESPNKDVALFFGLSGTGKTTLSTTGDRALVGDDEHLWDDEGFVSNVEGGCYAKCLNLDESKEPTIYRAIKRNALLENVDFFEPGRRDSNDVDYASGRKTPNTRVSYPLTHVPNRVETRVPAPKTIIFLACDAFGVLPAVSVLAPEEAAYHFLSGYTSKVSGTERGVDDPVATFSACYGAAFLPLHPTVYAQLLQQKMAKHGVDAFLVNTGWAGGPATKDGATRMPITLTRTILDAIFDGTIKGDGIRHPTLNLRVPAGHPTIPTHVLHPWASWADRSHYEAAANSLAHMFVANFNQYHNPAIAQHGPRPTTP
mmetsp:Transcript_27337/g.88303  ORF Transcript_27337/g.88303 Transcript_27337/m.88303 type:complete len:599 (+) Transcript_27337:65-1861(+)